LNDTLIEFGLKYVNLYDKVFDDIDFCRLWLADLQETNPELASQVHVFNSFFYKKLSTKMCVKCFVRKIFSSVLSFTVPRKVIIVSGNGHPNLIFF
jgi:Ulp1 family protease